MDNILEAIIAALLSILIMSGAGFVLWWAVESIKQNCSNSNCCKKKYDWECPKCGKIEESDEQPYCKTCSHIERFDVKMEKLENK